MSYVLLTSTNFKITPCFTRLFLCLKWGDDKLSYKGSCDEFTHLFENARFAHDVRLSDSLGGTGTNTYEQKALVWYRSIFIISLLFWLPAIRSKGWLFCVCGAASRSVFLAKQKKSGWSPHQNKDCFWKKSLTFGQWYAKPNLIRRNISWQNAKKKP